MSRRLLQLAAKWRPSRVAPPPAFQCLIFNRSCSTADVPDEAEDEVAKSYRYSNSPEKQPRQQKKSVVPPREWLHEAEDAEGSGDEEDRDLRQYLRLRRSKEDSDNEESEEALYSTDDEAEFDKIRESNMPLDEQGRRMWDYRDLTNLSDSPEDLQKGLDELLKTAPAYDRRIAVVRLKLAMQLQASKDKDSHKIVSLGKEALKVFGVGNDDSTEEGLCLSVIGFGYRGLGEYELSLSYLRRALAYFEKKEEEGQKVMWDMHAVLIELARTLVALDRTKEALGHYHHALNLLECLLGPDSEQLGEEFRNAAEYCCQINDWKEAKEDCEKALRIHSKRKGKDSVDVAIDRRLLALVYTGLEQHEEAIEQLRICRQIYLKQKEYGYRGAFYATIEIAKSQMKLKLYNEAVATLEGAMMPTTAPLMQGLVHIQLARAFVFKKNFNLARDQCKSALDVYKLGKGLEERDEFVSQLTDIAKLFDEIGDRDESIAAVKQALDVYRPDPGYDRLSVNMQIQLGSQLMKYGRADEALFYYKESLEIFEQMELFSVNLHILTAKAYMELSKYGAALELLEKAKVEVEKSEAKADRKKTSTKQASKWQVIPDRLPLYQTLVEAYQAVGRLDAAIRSQELVVEELLSLKASGKEVSELLKEETGTYVDLMKMSKN